MKGVGYGVGAALAAAVVFQLFLRYQYIPEGRSVVVRVDRLTGSSCALPCKPKPPPPPTPEPTEFNADAARADFDSADDAVREKAVDLAKTGENAATVVAEHAGSGAYEWQTTPDTLDRMLAVAKPDPDETPHPVPTPYPVRLVCYCDKKGVGWRWEVHTDTAGVYYVNDNADLSKKWGLTAGK